MSDMTVVQLAKIVKIESIALLSKLKEAGIEKSSTYDIVTDKEKTALLAHLQSDKQSSKKLSLKKKGGSSQQAQATGQSGKVEVRKKRKVVMSEQQKANLLNEKQKTTNKPYGNESETSKPAFEKSNIGAISGFGNKIKEDQSTFSGYESSQAAKPDNKDKIYSQHNEPTEEVEKKADSNVSEKPSNQSSSLTQSASYVSSEHEPSEQNIKQQAEKRFSDEQNGQKGDPAPVSSNQDASEKASASASSSKESGQKDFSSQYQKLGGNLSQLAIKRERVKQAQNVKQNQQGKTSESEQATQIDQSASSESLDTETASKVSESEKNKSEFVQQNEATTQEKDYSDKDQASSKAAKKPSKKKKPKGKKKQSDKDLYSVSEENAAEDESAVKTLDAKQSRKKPDLSKIKTQQFKKPAKPVKRTIELPETITVAELAQKMAVKASDVIKSLMKMGMMLRINDTIDQETAGLIVEEFGHAYVQAQPKPEVIERELENDRETTDVRPRAPVITIMGHVDHGKTSLLDHIRTTRITSKEAGGITQHIGAYSVKTNKGDLTFLDTPGHEAFTSMRSRGANSTDIVILVVAADDGVMPQTIEAIDHAKAAGVPLVVAVNKTDKPSADPERVMNELGQRDVIPEQWGGDVIFTEVSAITGEGVEELLENVALQSEILELLDPKRGPVATVLVQKGQLKQGDHVLAGMETGSIRALINDQGKHVKSAGPSTPVEILGLSGVPNAGDEVLAVKDEKKARELAEYRQEQHRQEQLKQQQERKLANVFNNMGEEKATLNIVIKADVQGSLEAIKDALNNIHSEEVDINIIRSGLGGIATSDITLAVASNAVVLGYNVRADVNAKEIAHQKGVDLRYYSVIYDVINDVKKAISGMLSPELKEKIVGVAQVREVFRSAKYGSIAGCMVVEGMIKRNNPIRVLRDQVVIFEGKLESLKRYKEDVMEVKRNMECGIGVKNYNDVKPGDQIEVFETIEVAREIS
jgi:translation initiation factor IF-2